MILECDFDTPLPSIDDLEENEEWSVEKSLGELSPPAPGRMMSCFNATAVLCMCVTAILFIPKLRAFFSTQLISLAELFNRCMPYVQPGV